MSDSLRGMNMVGRPLILKMALLQDLEMLRVSSSPNLIKPHLRELNKPVAVILDFKKQKEVRTERALRASVGD